MACSKCKNKGVKQVNTIQSNKPHSDIVKSFLVLLIKIMLFLVSGIILTVIVIPFSIYLLFKSIFIDSNLDASLMMQAVKKIASTDITTKEKIPS